MLNNDKQPSKPNHFSNEKVQRRRSCRTGLCTTKHGNIPRRKCGEPVLLNLAFRNLLLLGTFYSKSMFHVFALYVNKSILDNLLLGTVVALLSYLSSISTTFVCCLYVKPLSHTGKPASRP